MDGRIKSTAVRFSLQRASRPAFPAPSPCLPPSSCPDLIRASTGAAAPSRRPPRKRGRRMDARIESTAVRFSLRRGSRPAFPAPSPCLPPSSCPAPGSSPGVIRASTGAAAPPDGALYRWRQWLRGSSPRMGGRITPGLDPGAGHDGVVVAVEEYGSRVRPAPPVGARNEAGVTTEGQGRQVRACGDPCPDPVDAPISRPEQGFAPGPAI